MVAPGLGRRWRGGKWNRLHEPGLDLATKVILESGNSLGSAQLEGQASVEVLRHDAGALEFQVESPADGYLVASDPYYPGWEATVDGQPTQILRADDALRAVAVRAGSHRITMVYRPVTWRVGLVLTVGTALAVLLLVVAQAFRGRLRACLTQKRKTEPNQ